MGGHSDQPVIKIDPTILAVHFLITDKIILNVIGQRDETF